MMQRLGRRVLAVDFDPQSDLTAAFLDEEELAELWQEFDGPGGRAQEAGRANGVSRLSDRTGTVAAAVRPIMDGLGDVDLFDPVEITERLWLVPGDLGLSAFEDRLSAAWPLGLTGTDRAALGTTTSFYRIVDHAIKQTRADIVLIDLGPNLGATNRAAVLAADAVLMPLAADLFSLHGLQSLGPTLREWRSTWQQYVLPGIPPDILAPVGLMTPLGYVVRQSAVRLDKPVKPYRRWRERIPQVFYSAVLGLEFDDPSDRSYEIDVLHNYQSLIPLSRDARKPMFDLRPADGALGSTQTYVQRCYQDYRELSLTVLDRLAEVASPE